MADPFLYLFWAGQIGVLRACPPLHDAITGNNYEAANSRAQWTRTLFRLVRLAPGALWSHWRDVRAGRALLARADYIYDIELTGGEALLHPDLDEVLRLCADSGKVKHIGVQSNGTVIPAEKVLAAIKEAKATVRISDYGPALQPDVEKLKSILLEKGIRFTHSNDSFWYDIGALGQSKEGLAKRRFSVCLQRKLKKKRVLTACHYCLGATYKSPKVPVAVQREGRASE
jgi:hypothetical protein